MASLIVGIYEIFNKELDSSCPSKSATYMGNIYRGIHAIATCVDKILIGIMDGRAGA